MVLRKVGFETLWSAINSLRWFLWVVWASLMIFKHTGASKRVSITSNTLPQIAILGVILSKDISVLGKTHEKFSWNSKMLRQNSTRPFVGLTSWFVHSVRQFAARNSCFQRASTWLLTFVVPRYSKFRFFGWELREKSIFNFGLRHGLEHWETRFVANFERPNSFYTVSFVVRNSCVRAIGGSGAQKASETQENDHWSSNLNSKLVCYCCNEWAQLERHSGCLQSHMKRANSELPLLRC